MFDSPSFKKEMQISSNIKQIGFSIKIKDQGEGISKEGIENLFLDFSRLEEN